MYASLGEKQADGSVNVNPQFISGTAATAATATTAATAATVATAATAAAAATAATTASSAIGSSVANGDARSAARFTQGAQPVYAQGLGLHASRMMDVVSAPSDAAASAQGEGAEDDGLQTPRKRRKAAAPRRHDPLLELTRVANRVTNAHEPEVGIGTGLGI